MEHSIKSLGKSVGKSVGKSPTSHSSHTVLFNQLKQLKYLFNDILKNKKQANQITWYIASLEQSLIIKFIHTLNKKLRVREIDKIIEQASKLKSRRELEPTMTIDIYTKNWLNMHKYLQISLTLIPSLKYMKVCSS